MRVNKRQTSANRFKREIIKHHIYRFWVGASPPAAGSGAVLPRYSDSVTRGRGVTAAVEVDGRGSGKIGRTGNEFSAA